MWLGLVLTGTQRCPGGGGGADRGELGLPKASTPGAGPTQGQRRKPAPSLLVKKHGCHPPQTTLLDLMDALPGSGPAAQKAEPWGPSTSAGQTNPWGGPAAQASASDPWPAFGKEPLFTPCHPLEGEGLQGGGAGSGFQASAAPRKGRGSGCTASPCERVSSFVLSCLLPTHVPRGLSFLRDGCQRSRPQNRTPGRETAVPSPGQPSHVAVTGQRLGGA